MDWSTACPDWERRILAGESLVPPPLFPDQAEAGLSHFRELRIVDAPGSPTMREVCRPWLFDFVGSIFGAYDAETGRRLITEFFLLISKKNAKSTGAAGIMLSALTWNWRESAEFLIVAPTIEVANNSFYPARDMVRKDSELSDLLHVQDHYRTITHRITNATLKVVAADNEAVGGKKATGILIDELWMFGKRPGAENMLREATGGLASRPEGFVIYASTQSDEAPAGVFRQKLMYARGVRDGRIIDKRFLPVLYEFPQKIVDAKGYLDFDNLHITNPNLGASVDEEFLRRELGKAKENGHESIIGFLAKHANVEIGLALKSDGWAGAEYWEPQALAAGLSLDDVLSRSEVLTVGIDGGGLDDLLGLAVMGREKASGDWLLWNRAYAHPSVLERRKSEAARFEDFQRDGDLAFVESVGEDVDEVAGIVDRCLGSGMLNKVGVDVAGIGAIVDALVGIGVKDDQIVGVPQGWKLNGAIKTTERKLAARQLWHGGQRMMSWCVGNAKVEPRGNAITITKQAAGSAKIDPLMATFNAAQLMSMNPQIAPKPKLFFA
jgi:phage terminase large subunit-like protein